jgi:hypothetical protein
MLKECKTKECQANCNRCIGKSKKYRPRTRWRDDVEEDLNIIVIKYGQVIVRDCQKWRNAVLEAKVNGL